MIQSPPSVKYSVESLSASPRLRERVFPKIDCKALQDKGLRNRIFSYRRILPTFCSVCVRNAAPFCRGEETPPKPPAGFRSVAFPFIARSESRDERVECGEVKPRDERVECSEVGFGRVGQNGISSAISRQQCAVRSIVTD